MKNPGHNTSPIPDLLLERYRFGELSPAEMERLRKQLKKDQGLRDRLQALDDSDAAIRLQYPPGWLAARIRQRLRANTRIPSTSIIPRSVGWRIPIMAAAAAMVILGVGLHFLGPLSLPSWMTSPELEPAERLKGGNIVLFRKTQAGSEMLGDGARVKAGDQLRIGYRAAGRSYGVILSIDGRGAVTCHLPQQGEQAAQLAQGGLVLLDHAYELDDAPGWERFYLVTAAKAFKVAPVLRAANTAGAGASTTPPGALKLGDQLEQNSLILIKETAP